MKRKLLINLRDVVYNNQNAADDIPGLDDLGIETGGGGGGSPEPPTSKDLVTDLSDDQKKIIEKYKGQFADATYFDKTGNVVDKEGKVIIESTKLKELENSSSGTYKVKGEVEIDGVMYDLGEDGNAYNKQTKTVHKTAKEIAEYETVIDLPKTVEIDGVTYDVNENGEVVDKDKKVIKTKEDLIKLMKENKPESNLINIIQSHFGYEIKDETGKKVEFANTTQGLFDYIKAVSNVKANAETDKRFKTYPDVEEYFNFRQNGGNKSDFFVPDVDYSSFQLDEKNKPQMKEVVKKNLVEKGNSSDDADSLVQLYEDKGQLVAKAKESVSELNGRRETKKADLLKKQADIAKAEETRTIAYWGKVKETVDKGVISGFKIPEADRQGFFDFIAKDADGNGNSSYAITLQKKGMESDLVLKYFAYKNFDLKALVQERLDDFLASKTKEAVLKLKTKKTSGSSFSGNLDDISLD